MYAAVEVNADVQLITEGFPQRFDAFNDFLHFRIAVDVVQFFRSVHLDRIEAAINSVLRLLDDILRSISADP